MMRKIVAVAIATAVLAGCGGGSDGAPEAPSHFNGTYTGNLIKTQDNCAIGGQYNGAAHVLRTEGPEVVVTVNTLVMRGTPNNLGHLEAIYETTNNGVTTRAIARYAVREGTTPGEAFDTTLTVQGSQGNVTCSLTFAGTVYRQ
jgi:hypothetical protein